MNAQRIIGTSALVVALGSTVGGCAGCDDTTTGATGSGSGEGGNVNTGSSSGQGGNANTESSSGQGGNVNTGSSSGQGGNAPCTTGAGGAGGGAEESGGSSCALWVGDKQSGSTLDDRILGMTRDESNNLYIVGFEEGLTGVTNIEPDGDSLGFVEKRAPNGTLLWRHVFDTAGTDTAERVVVDDARDRVYVVGRTSGSFPGQTHAGQFDLFLAAFEPNGNLLDLLQAGTDRPQHPAALTVLPEGDVMIVGYDDVFIESNYVVALEDPFLVRFAMDQSQKLQQISWWQAQTPATDFLTGVAAAKDGSGAVFVTGMSVSGVDRGIFAKKLDKNGTLVWRTMLSTVTFDWVADVTLSPQGEPIVAGSTFLTLGGKSFGEQDAFAAKLSPDTGALQWVVQFGSAASEWVTSVAVDKNGKTYVAGSSPESVIPGQSTNGAEEPFVFGVDASGVVVGQWQANTNAREFVNALSPDGCSSVVLGGVVEGNLFTPSAGMEDVFIQRIAP